MKKSFWVFLMISVLAILNTSCSTGGDASSGSGDNNSLPIVKISSPKDGMSFVSGAKVSIAAYASSEVGIKNLEILRGNTVLCKTKAEQVSCNINPADGNYGIIARAKDKNGGTGYSNAVHFSVGDTNPTDNKAPTVYLTGPADGATYSAPATLTASIYAIDGEKDPMNLEILQGYTVLTSCNNSESCSIQITGLPAGNYVFWGRATDSHGNIGVSSLGRIKVGAIANVNLAPIAFMTGPANGGSYSTLDSFTVSVYTVDPDGDAMTIELWQGTTLLTTCATAPCVFQIASLPAGKYVFWAKVTDSHGAITIANPVNITVGTPPVAANNAPIVIITNPAKGSEFTAPYSGTVRVMVIDPDNDAISAVQIFLNGVNIGGTITSLPFDVNVSALPAGTYTVLATVTDSRGGVGHSELISFTVGNPPAETNTPPTVFVVNPTAGADYSTLDSFTVGAIAMDSDGTISQLEIWQGTTRIMLCTASPCNIQVGSLPVGYYTFWATATDDDGATSFSTLITIKVGNPPATINYAPTIILTYPGNNMHFETTGSLSLTATADASDPENDNLNISFFLNGVLISSDNTEPFSAALNNLAAGNYTVYAKATDSAGNVSFSQIIVFTVGNPPAAVNTAPTVILTSPANNANFLVGDIINFSALAADAENDNVSVRFICGSFDLGTDNLAPYSLDVSTLPVGVYTCLATATDEHGAIGYSQTITITVGNPPVAANEPPTVLITSPASGATYSTLDSFTVSAIGFDDKAIAQIQIWQGNSLLITCATSSCAIHVSNLAVGYYTYWARATDNEGASSVSDLINIQVGNPPAAKNTAPIVQLYSPSDGWTCSAPATLTIGAFATDADGDTITVTFMQGATVIGGDSTEPYSLSLSNLPAGHYVFWAIAEDSHGGKGVSQFISVTVGNPPIGIDKPPLVAIVSPAEGATYSAIAKFYVSANAAGQNGRTIDHVDILVGSTLKGTVYAAPYVVLVKILKAGTYNVWAKAVDSNGNIGYSDFVTITIIQPPAVGLEVCYSGLPANSYGQAASLDPDTGGWIPYSDLVFDSNGCATITAIDGRIPYIFWDTTNGKRIDNLWYGGSLSPAAIYTDGTAYAPPFSYPALSFFDGSNGGGAGVGDGWFICLADDCGLHSGYGHILLKLFADADGDGVINTLDDCQLYANDQTDSNSDGIGDACDGRDSDNDGYLDIDDAYPSDPTQH